ncbi:ABC transporter permease [Exilibacterium tricleocarpae]|uniref:ABC transporter permease n=1 Tax=Exilibacterium tricleocarpae TaxID=2591008 RepID=A0A545ST96_9GAMM|nr:ABC transporter permease [Exilibacterium tricleocarpae]
MQTLTLFDLSFALIPVVVVAMIYARWLGGAGQVAVASARMVLQLLLVGYALQYVFAQDARPLSLAVLLLMITVSTAIALRPVSERGKRHWQAALLGIGGGGSLNLALVMGLVLGTADWHLPSTLIPLAGMVYASGMNAVSLAAERFSAEIDRGEVYIGARRQAFNSAMLPQINSLLAVGLVSLPGMMTGQILSGVSPLIAVRYQIMVMCMLLGSAGIGAALYLWWLGRGNEIEKAGEASG